MQKLQPRVEKVNVESPHYVYGLGEEESDHLVLILVLIVRADQEANFGVSGGVKIFPQSTWFLSYLIGRMN